MAAYSELAAELKHANGFCVFDGVALQVLGKYAPVDKQEATADGEKIEIKDGDTVIASDILVHKNGREGSKDLTKDSLVITLAQLVQFPDDLQDALYPNEKVPSPTGRRPDKGDTEIKGDKKLK